MQKQTILRYASVKCTNPPPSNKNPVIFQNSLIYNKTKEDLLRKEEPNPANVYSKNVRLHTEGSQPYEKSKYFFYTTADKEKRQKQPFETRYKEEDKKNMQTYGQKLQKGNSEKQFKFVGNFVNIKKNDCLRKQKPAEVLPFWLKKDAPSPTNKTYNNFVDASSYRPEPPVKNAKQANGFCVGGQYSNSKQQMQQASQTQPSTNYVRRTVKTQADEVVSNQIQVDQQRPVQYFRKSFKSSIRKTQTDDQPSKCRFTATFNFDKNENVKNGRNSDKMMAFDKVMYARDNKEMGENKQNRKTTFQQREKACEQVAVERQRYTTAGFKEKSTASKITQSFKPFTSSNFNTIQNPQKSTNEKNPQQNTHLNNEKYMIAQNQRRKPRMNTQENEKQPKTYLYNKQRAEKPVQQTNTSSLTHKQPPTMIDWKRDLLLMDKIGEGTFGKVYKGKLRQENINKTFAIKRVFIDKKYKSRELEIVQELNHPEVMKVHNVFVTTKDSSEQYLNIVMDFYDRNLFEVVNDHFATGEKITNAGKSIVPNGNNKITELQQKLFIYQMLKGLSYIHSLKICHRDIKPHNMLVKGWELVLCDFGSAKKLISGETNLSYICSRCYRAPELIFGSTTYTTQIDLWSVGCVVLQMLNGLPLFIGQNSLDHLLEVIKVVGTPTKNEVLQMNENYDITEFDLPMIKRKSLSKLFPKADPKLIDLVNKLLVYNPNERLTAIQALAHPYFDQLRRQETFNTLEGYLPKEKLWGLFQFSAKEIQMYCQALEGRNKLVKNSVNRDKQPKLMIKRSSSANQIIAPSWWKQRRFT